MNSKFLRSFIILIGIFLIANTLKDIIDLWRSGDRVTVQEFKVAKLQNKNDELQKQLADLESPAYVEKVARDKLNLAKPGEYIVILPKERNATLSAETVDNRPNWQKWREVIF